MLNPAVTDATTGSTICVSGWTGTVRPPASYTGDLKRLQMAALGLSGTAQDYEEDHRVPLELGGSPDAANNLAPEKRSAAGGTAETKDRDESLYKQRVCAGQLSLKAAQREFVTRWLGPWPTYRQ